MQTKVYCINFQGTVTRLWAGRPGIDFRQELGYFRFPTEFISVLGPT